MVFSTHRGHGHALAKGVPPRELIAELFGRATGCSRGRGGSMHLFAPEVGMMGTSGIVGPCILQAAGAGYSFKLLKTDRVAVAFFGDGAVNNGAFHEGLNMASIWKLPVLFVCENNQFATEVPFSYAAGNPGVAARAAAYGMPGVEVDGNDVLAVYEAAGEAVDRARASGEGPTLLECKTYRTRPHAEGMGDFTYRTREEVEAWKTAAVRSDSCGNSCSTKRSSAKVELDRDRRRDQATGRRGPAVRRSEPLARRGRRDVAHVLAERDLARERVPRPRWTTEPAPQAPREITFMQATLEALTAARWPAIRRSSSWAKASASAAATSRRPPGCTTATAPSGCATRRSASAASSASAAARP